MNVHQSCSDLDLLSLEHSSVLPALRNIANHWREARKQQKMPGWSAIRPAAIAAQLPIVWSYSYDSTKNTFTGRLAGSKVAQIFGSNFRGIEMSAVNPTADFENLFSICKRVISEPAIYYGVGVLFKRADQLCLGERIILPLAHDGLVPDGIIGATDFKLVHGATKSFMSEAPTWYTL
jgi:hypothetical protein